MVQSLHHLVASIALLMLRRQCCVLMLQLLLLMLVLVVVCPWQRAVSLAPILEPVADLRQCQSSTSRQRTLLLWGRVTVHLEAIPECIARSFLQTVDRLLAVPDRPRKWMLSAQSILVNSSQRSTSYALCLGIVTSVPQLQGNRRKWLSVNFGACLSVRDR
jgi:hypothetical protein